MIVIAMTVVFEDVYGGNFTCIENFRVQYERVPGTGNIFIFTYTIFR